MKIMLPPYQEKEEGLIDLYLFRHGYTCYNRENRYQGRSDLPLLEEEFSRIRPYSFFPEKDIGRFLAPKTGNAPAQKTGRWNSEKKGSGPYRDGTIRDVVYVSGALRTRQTAELLFPGMEQIVIPQFHEMDFGIFEGRSAEEMKSDPQYRKWVDSMCEDPVPGGENRAQFTERVTDRFYALVQQTVRESRKRLLIVAHGGTQMAVMDCYCEENRPYWSWSTLPGEAIIAKLRV